MERPDWNSLTEMFADVKRTWAGIGDTQQRMLQLTGVAWSDDRLVKVVVGPRGHLLELEIDPRVYRKPNSKELAATIVETSRRAVEEVARQSREILEETLPADMRGLVSGESGLGSLLHSHDAQVREKMEQDDG